MGISPSVHQCSARIICNPENAALFSTLCNIIEQLPNLFSNLDGVGVRRLGENRNLSNGSFKTVFAPTNRAFSKWKGLFDFKKEAFSPEEKVELKTLVQTHIIGGGVVKTFEELECNKTYQNINGNMIEIRCKEDRGTLKKYVIGNPGSVQTLGASSPKITSQDNRVASNGIIHPLNNLVWQ